MLLNTENIQHSTYSFQMPKL